MNKETVLIAALVCILFAIGGILYFEGIEKAHSPTNADVTSEIQEEEITCTGSYNLHGLNGYIHKIHDSKGNVTCWVYRGGQRGGISCIPDHMLSP